MPSQPIPSDYDAGLRACGIFSSRWELQADTEADGVLLSSRVSELSRQSLGYVTPERAMMCLASYLGLPSQQRSRLSKEFLGLPCSLLQSVFALAGHLHVHEVPSNHPSLGL